jgi:putative Holliday junction resolvase
MRVLALDYGSARTGVAISDETGTIASPLAVVERVGTESGFVELCALIAAHDPARVVVGSPRPLSGGDNAQSRTVAAFVKKLRSRLSLPVVTYDERFTTAIAQSRGGVAAIDARAAAQILEDYLRTSAAGSASGEAHG